MTTDSIIHVDSLAAEVNKVNAPDRPTSPGYYIEQIRRSMITFVGPYETHDEVKKAFDAAESMIGPRDWIEVYYNHPSSFVGVSWGSGSKRMYAENLGSFITERTPVLITSIRVINRACIE